MTRTRHRRASKNAERRLKRNTQMLWCAWLRLVLRMKEKRMSELKLLQVKNTTVGSIVFKIRSSRMNKFGNCPLCGKQVKPTNLRKIARQNRLYGFRMALDGIAATWGALIQNLRCDADLTDEQVQKIIRIGDRYWEMVGKFKEEDMTPDEFADYITAKSEQVEKELRERWS
nr:MAG TPA: Rad50 zinc hook motif [Caudoviricetes sp.]